MIGCSGDLVRRLARGGKSAGVVDALYSSERTVLVVVLVPSTSELAVEHLVSESRRPVVVASVRFREAACRG